MTREAFFPGLRPLRPDEAHRLRGRDALVASLVARVRAGASLVLTGPPGVGRSSLLAAGLLPALREAPVGELDVPAYRASSGRRLLPRLVPSGEPIDAAAGAEEGAARVFLVDDADALDTDAQRALCALARDPLARFVLVASDRSFLPALDRELAEVAVEPLPPDALAATLEGAGVSWVPGLADAMVSELGDDPAAVAWLQFAAMRLCAARERPDATLTHTALHALGGVRGCLPRHVEATLAARPRAEREAAATLLDALVSDASAPSRPREEVLARLSPPAASLLDALVVAGLARASGPRVALAHPVVATAWPASNASRVAARHLLRDTPPRLRRGPLALAVACGLGSFLAAHHVVRANVAAAVALDRATSDLLRTRHALDLQRLEAMASRARVLDASDPPAALLVALAAYDDARGGGAEDAAAALVQARSDVAPAIRLAGHEGSVGMAAFSPDGTRVATTDEGGATLWSAALGRPVTKLEPGGARGTAAAFSLDGERLAIAASDGRVFVLSSRDGAANPAWQVCVGAANWVGWSRDRRRLLVGCARGDLVALDASTRGVAWRRPAVPQAWARLDTDGVRALVVRAPECCGSLVGLSWEARHACETSGEALTLDLSTGAVASRTPVDACRDVPIALDPDGDGVLLGQDDGRETGRPTPRDREVNCENLFPDPTAGRVVGRCLERWRAFDATGEVTLAERLPQNGVFLDRLSSAAGIVFQTHEGLSVWNPGAASPRLLVRGSARALAFAPTGDALALTIVRPNVDLRAARPPPHRDVESLRAWALARSNLRVCRRSLAVAVFAGGALPDSPWMPDAVHPCAEASP